MHGVAGEGHKMEKDIVGMLSQMKLEGYRVKVVKGHTAALKHMEELKTKEEEEQELMEEQRNECRKMQPGTTFILKLFIPNRKDDEISALLQNRVERVVNEVLWIYQVKTDHVCRIIAIGDGDICPGKCGDADRKISPGVKKYGIAVFTLSPETIKNIRRRIYLDDGEYDEVEAFRRYLYVGFRTFFNKFRPEVLTLLDIECPTLRKQVCEMIVIDGKRTEEERRRCRPFQCDERRLLTGFYPAREGSAFHPDYHPPAFEF